MGKRKDCTAFRLSTSRALHKELGRGGVLQCACLTTDSSDEETERTKVSIWRIGLMRSSYLVPTLGEEVETLRLDEAYLPRDAIMEARHIARRYLEHNSASTTRLHTRNTHTPVWRMRWIEAIVCNSHRRRDTFNFRRHSKSGPSAAQDRKNIAPYGIYRVQLIPFLRCSCQATSDHFR